MKVKILSGNAAGQFAEMNGAELEFNLSTGFVVPVGEGDAPASEPVVEPPAAPADAAADAAAADPAEPGT